MDNINKILKNEIDINKLSLNLYNLDLKMLRLKDLLEVMNFYLINNQTGYDTTVNVLQIFIEQFQMFEKDYENLFKMLNSHYSPK